MATFFASIKGTRGEASRLGSGKSGITATAASFSGAITTKLFVHNGEVWAKVSAHPWKGSGDFAKILYRGPVGRFEDHGDFDNLRNSKPLLKTPNEQDN